MPNNHYEKKTRRRKKNFSSCEYEQRMKIRFAIIYHTISLTSILILFTLVSFSPSAFFALKLDKTNGKIKGITNERNGTIKDKSYDYLWCERLFCLVMLMIIMRCLIFIWIYRPSKIVKILIRSNTNLWVFWLKLKLKLLTIFDVNIFYRKISRFYNTFYCCTWNSK